MPANSFAARWLPSILGSLVLSLIASGCVHQGYSRAQVYSSVYPQSVSVHATRYQQHGVTLVFDSSLDCYVVVGHADHYFYGNRYYRLHRGGWQVGAHIRGPWVTLNVRTLPPGLGRHHARALELRRRAAVREREHQLVLARQRLEQQRRAVERQRVAERRLEQERRKLKQQLAAARRKQQQDLERARVAQERKRAEVQRAAERRLEKDRRKQEQELRAARQKQQQDVTKQRAEKKRQEAKDRRDAAQRRAEDRRTRVLANR